uniref:Putative secreted protein n=1 Tax=Anopheles triannulatus TaxID=58253 RepID=A0A2M4B5F4_9DIPT
MQLLLLLLLLLMELLLVASGSRRRFVLIHVVIGRDRVGVRVGGRRRGWRKRFLLLQYRPELLDGFVEGPQLRQQRQIQLTETIHFSSQDCQLGVQGRRWWGRVGRYRLR